MDRLPRNSGRFFQTLYAYIAFVVLVIIFACMCFLLMFRNWFQVARTAFLEIFSQRTEFVQPSTSEGKCSPDQESQMPLHTMNWQRMLQTLETFTTSAVFSSTIATFCSLFEMSDSFHSVTTAARNISFPQVQNSLPSTSRNECFPRLEGLALRVENFAARQMVRSDSLGKSMPSNEHAQGDCDLRSFQESSSVSPSRKNKEEAVTSSGDDKRKSSEELHRGRQRSSCESFKINEGVGPSNRVESSPRQKYLEGNTSVIPVINIKKDENEQLSQRPPNERKRLQDSPLKCPKTSLDLKQSNLPPKAERYREENISTPRSTLRSEVGQYPIKQSAEVLQREDSLPSSPFANSTILDRRNSMETPLESMGQSSSNSFSYEACIQEALTEESTELSLCEKFQSLAISPLNVDANTFNLSEISRETGMADPSSIPSASASDTSQEMLVSEETEHKDEIEAEKSSFGSPLKRKKESSSEDEGNVGVERRKSKVYFIPQPPRKLLVTKSHDESDDFFEESI